jgi:uncharacterized cupin superfamily protein
VARQNVFTAELQSTGGEAGFKGMSAAVGRMAGGQRLGVSVYVLEPGATPFPYHFHRANEELLVVLKGRPTVRTPEGERELEEGAVVAFRPGPTGAHQVINRSSELVRYLMFSTRRSPEMLHYPDSGKIGVWSMPQEGDDPSAFPRFIFRAADAADYFDDEQAPS